MPYIKQEARVQLRPHTMREAVTPGELTYQLSEVVRAFLDRRAGRTTNTFADFAEALGALEATKLELYRRVVAPYEDKKREENGDVY